MYTDELIERVSNFKNIYNGQTFQWIKNYPNQAAAGSILEIIDIEIHNSGQIIALFKNNQRVTIEQLNSDFQMIGDPSDILSPDQIFSLNSDPGLTKELISNTKSITTNSSKNVFTENDIVQTSPHITPVEQPKIQPANIFGMFSLSPTKLKIEVEVNLPAMNLLKAMYSQSSDKDLFLKQITEYIHSNIKTESVKDSIFNKIGSSKKLSGE